MQPQIGDNEKAALTNARNESEDTAELDGGDITNVPRSKEDKNTADEEESPRQQLAFDEPGNQLFDEDRTDSMEEERKVEIKKDIFNDHEEEKVGKDQNDEQQNERDDLVNQKSLKSLLYDIQIHPSQQQDKLDANIEEINQMKKLAVEVLNLMWLYCMEDTAVPNNQ